MSRVTLFLVGLTLLICSHPSYAQEEAPGLLDLRIVTVKPNRIAEWVELQHQLNAAREEAGMSAREFWQVEIGDLDTFHIFTPIEKLGEGEPARPPGEAGYEAIFLSEIIHGGNTRTWYSVNGLKASQHEPHFHVHVVPKYDHSEREKLYLQRNYDVIPIEVQRQIAQALREALQ